MSMPFLPQAFEQRKPSGKAGFMPSSVNKKALPLNLKQNEARRIINLIKEEDGTMRVRGGLTKTIMDATSGLTITHGAKLNDTESIYGYNNGTNSYVKIWNGSTLSEVYSVATPNYTISSVYTDTTNDINGVRYGKYYIIGNGDERPYMITILIDAGFMVFTTDPTGHVGETITGVTSGETATIKAEVTGFTYIYVEDISGDFTAGEVCDLSGGGRITLSSSGTNSRAIRMGLGTADSNTPRAFYFLIHRSNASASARLITANLRENSGNVQYSETHDDDTQIPFLIGWTPTLATAASNLFTSGELAFQSGNINSLVTQRNIIVIGGDNGAMTFSLDSQQSAFSELHSTIHYQQDNFGMNKGALAIDQYGIFYANETGVFNAIFSGNDKQETNIIDILGKAENDKFDFTNVKFLYDPTEVKLYIFLTRSSSPYGLVFDLKTKEFQEIDGSKWHFADVWRDQKEFYGVADDSLTLYKLFDGNDDDGDDITSRLLMKQESFGELERLGNVTRSYIAGYFTPDTELTIKYHWWNRGNVLQTSDDLTITTTNTATDANDLEIETLFKTPRIRKVRNARRYQIELTATSDAYYKFNTISTEEEIGNEPIGEIATNDDNFAFPSLRITDTNEVRVLSDGNARVTGDSQT